MRPPAELSAGLLPPPRHRLRQPFQPVIGKFDLVQVLLCLVQIIQNVGAGGAVLPAEPVNGIQPGLDLLQLLGGVGKGVLLVPKLLCGVLDLIHQVRHPLVEGLQTLVIPSDPGQGLLGLGQ